MATTSLDDIFVQSQGIFQMSDVDSDVSILPLQIAESDPLLPTLAQQSGLLPADQATSYRLAQFDGEQYDLRETSHLTRFMRALLGDAGAGQVRKRYTLARLQTLLSHAHFYDLDGFYGSLFGVSRTQPEGLVGDPMLGLHTPDHWDSLSSVDALFRERIIALAKSLPMSGTVEGIKMAAEALLGCECEVYETWRMLDAGYSTSSGQTWAQVQATYPTWGSIKPGTTWGLMAGEVEIGPTGLSNPDEIFVRPLKDYVPSQQAGDPIRDVELQKMRDANDVTRVLRKISPASTMVTFDPNGAANTVQSKIAGIASDSDYWEVIQKVTPSVTGAPAKAAAYESSGATIKPGQEMVMPKPRFGSAQTTAWSFNGAISVVNGYQMTTDMDLSTGNGGTIVNREEWEVRDRVSTDSKPVAWLPPYGIADAGTILAAQTSNDAHLQAAPFSAPRQAVPTHG